MMREKQLYDVIVPMTKDNLSVFQMNIQYIRKIWIVRESL